MKKFLTKRYRPERHYMRGRGPMWLERHGGGIGGAGLVMDDPRGDSVSSTSIPSLRDAGAIRPVRPSTGDNMKKFIATIMTMTRFHVVVIAAGLLLAVSGPSFAAKRTLQKSGREKFREIAVSRDQVQRSSDPPV